MNKGNRNKNWVKKAVKEIKKLNLEKEMKGIKWAKLKKTLREVLYKKVREELEKNIKEMRTLTAIKCMGKMRMKKNTLSSKKES